MTVTRRLGVFGLPLEDVASRLSERLSGQNPRISLTAEQNEVSVLLTADADSAETAAALLDELCVFIRDRLGIFIYGEDVPDLQHRVVSLLLEKDKKIATAESCTAGILSGKLTEISGVSAVFECGVASYSNEIKHSVLGVPNEIIEAHGAISEQVAAAMATGVRRISGADFGIGITGVAGPEPSEGKPVGTVFIALADKKRVWVKKIEHQNADREAVRLFAVMTALDLARRYLEALPGVMAGAQSLEKPSSETMPFPVGKVKKRRWWSPLFPSKSQGKAAAFRAGALWLLIVSTIGVCAFSLYYFIYRPLHNEQIYNRLESVYYAGLTETSTVIDTSLYPEGMLSRFYALYDQNADVRGWLKVDGTSISYPVMDSRHSDYYSTHDFVGNLSAYGVPYFDSSADFSSPAVAKAVAALTVYGNRIDDDQMFSPLLHYTDPVFFASHEYLELSTCYLESRYRVVAVFYSDETEEGNDFNYTALASDLKNRSAFISALTERSLYTLPAAFNQNASLLFLSVDTVEDAFPGRRLVVVAEKLKPGTPETAFKIEQNSGIHQPVIAPVSSSTAKTTATTQKQTKTGKIVSTAKKSAVSTTKTPATTKPTTAPTTKPTTAPTSALIPPTTAAPSSAPSTEPTVFTTVSPDTE